MASGSKNNVSKPATANSGRAGSKAGGTGSTGTVGGTGTGTGPGTRDSGTAGSADASGVAAAETLVETWGGLDFSDLPPIPAPSDPPDFDTEYEPAPKRRASTSRSKKSGEPGSLGVPTDPDTSASFILLTANSVALQTAGYKAAMSDEEYAAMHRPLAEIIRQSKYSAEVTKYSAPFALIVASFAWVTRVVQCYREKHPARPKTPAITPNPETRATATVTTPEGETLPIVNGTKPEDVAEIASILAM